MSRPARIHKRGGFYYLVLWGRDVFLSDADRRLFSCLVREALMRCDVRLHAYCWMWNEARLLAEVRDVPIGRMVQRVASRYSRAFNQQRGTSGHVFQSRHRCVLISDRSRLPQIVHHIHWTPVGARLADDPLEYYWSSHRVYLGVEAEPMITSDLVLPLFAREGAHPRDSYRESMRNPEKLFGREVARISTTYIHGDAAYVRHLQHASLPTTKPASLEQLTNAVARKLGIDRDWILSASRRRDATLARALITWHAMQNSIATQRAVCEWLQRDPSTLFVACERYRRSHRHLFTQELTELLAHEQRHEPAPVVTR